MLAAAACLDELRVVFVCLLFFNVAACFRHDVLERIAIAATGSARNAGCPCPWSFVLTQDFLNDVWRMKAIQIDQRSVLPVINQRRRLGQLPKQGDVVDRDYLPFHTYAV